MASGLSMGCLEMLVGRMTKHLPPRKEEETVVMNGVRSARSERRPWRSHQARLLPWIPRLMILALAAFLGTEFLRGGTHRTLAWLNAPVLLPVLGAVILALTILYALVRRHVNRNVIVTGCMSLLCLLAAIPRVVPVAYPASIASTMPSASVRLPADVPLKVAWGGDTLKVNAIHVRFPDQRWAYDFVVAPYLTGSANLEDYGCYGVPVVAPAAGTVVAAHDGEPDMVPGRGSHNRQAPKGNYVAIRLEETGTYLILAHLKPGSLRVTTGERVEEGQLPGQCGNSGNTSEPHIHIHHQRQDPNLVPHLFAEGLPLYFRDQGGPPMPQGGQGVEKGDVILTGVTVQHVGR